MYTYDRAYCAHYGNGTVIVPDQIAGNQEAAADNNVIFPALRRGSTVMVRVDAEATGLYTTGVGDLVVIDAEAT